MENTPVAQPITLNSTGTAPVTVNSAAASGTGFSVSSASLPATLNPGQSLTLEVQFDPTTVGSFTGQLAISSSASSSTVGLSGVGESHEVDLSWTCPLDSSDPIVGYNIYRAPGGTTSYQRLNATPETLTAFADTAVQSGTAYAYVVTSVDGAGAESVPSNMTSVTIP
ncbi:MAG: choice-of-anchor D domain-containing protein [Terracidiphilus sp.]